MFIAETRKVNGSRAYPPASLLLILFGLQRYMRNVNVKKAPNILAIATGVGDTIQKLSRKKKRINCGRVVFFRGGEEHRSLKLSQFEQTENR